MLPALTSALALAALAAPVAADASGYNVHNPHRRLVQRSVTADANSVSGQKFDFIVVGGGIGGLVVGSRLAEWSNQTVLIVEAGGDGSDVAPRQEIPGYSYHKGLAYASPYGWNYSTVVQTESGNVEKKYPLGHGLGGSGAINGMFWGKASKDEYDSWSSTLFPDSKYKWNWESMDASIKKATTLQEPSAENKATFQIPVDASAHGHSGPLQIGWSKYIYPVVANWIPTWTGMGFPVGDHSSGNLHGGTIVPSTMDSAKGRRSDSRRGWIDGNTNTNLVVLTKHMGVKILFSDTKDASGNVVATGVQVQEAEGSTVHTIHANKEVIVSGGPINSPKLLQLSGIGPSSHLSSQGINTLVDLPVGFNLQDHAAFSLSWDTVDGIETWAELTSNEALAAEELAKWEADGSGKWTYVNEATGYVAQSDISGGAEGAAVVANSVDSDALIASLSSRHSIPASVQKGMKTQFALQKKWMTEQIGQVEIIFHLWGSSATNLVLQCALQHPFSRGTVMVNGANAWTMPAINPDYYSAPVDVTIMRDAATWLRTFAAAKPLGDVLVTEAKPGANVTDAALEEYFKKETGTEYHPVGTCAMLPKDEGGVVDSALKIYGTKNVRVVDSSIIPMHITAHTMGSTYGVAEFAADIIKGENTADFLNPPASSSSAPSSTGGASTASSAAGSASAASENSAAGSNSLSSGAKIGIGLGAGVGAAAILGIALFLFCRRRKTEPAATGKNGWYAAGEQNNQWSGDRAAESYPMYGASGGFRQRPSSVNTMDTADLPVPQRREDGRFSSDSRLY